MKKLRFSKSLLVACAIMMVGLGRDPASVQDSPSGTTGPDRTELAAAAASSGSPAAQSDKTPVAAGEAPRAPESSAEEEQSEEIIASDTKTDEYSEASVATEESEAIDASEPTLEEWTEYLESVGYFDDPESGARGDCPFCSNGCCGFPCVCESHCPLTRCSALCPGGNICASGCPDECSGILCPSNFCNQALCGGQPQCDATCPGGDICASGCPNECTVLCPGNLLCKPACGGSTCNVGCSPGVCGSGCPDECSFVLCHDNFCNQARCGGQPQCDITCPGGNICGSGCPDECSSILCHDNFCNQARCGGQPQCDVTCPGGNICGSGCPDECSPILCHDNFCDQAKCGGVPQCDVTCPGGNICGSGCPDECSLALCPGNHFCEAQCGGSPCDVGCVCDPRCPNTACDLICGGDPCSSGCPDECSPILCSQNPCSQQTPCGGVGERACCVFEQVPSCDSGLIEVSPCTNPDCGFLSCSLGTCVDPKCGGEGERACCVNEQLILGEGNCESGLIEVEEVLGTGGCTGDCACIGAGNLGLSSSGMCHRYLPCGGVGQRACCLASLRDPCDNGLVEVPGCSGDCFCGAGLLNKVNDGIEGTSSSTCVRFEDITEPTLNHSPPPPPSECSLRGYMDMHLHLFADLAHGGALLAGRPFYDDLGGEDVNDALRPCYATEDIIIDADGVEQTLDDTSSADGGCTSLGWGNLFSGIDCPEDLFPDFCGANSYKFHGCHGVFDEAIGSFVGTVDGAAFSLGAPAFSDWPQWSSTTHQQSYYRWLERAWRGGLRMVTMFAVTNGALCEGGIKKKYLDDAQKQLTDCNDSMAFIDLQLRAAYDFEDFIDRKVGGGVDSDGGWFRIVLTPLEARREIANGNMAVVLGIEMANLFNCRFIAPDTVPACTPVDGIIADPAACEAALTVNSDSGCTEAFVRSEVDRYYNDFGVRHIFPIHNFDNAFGGPATWQDAIEIGNRIIEKHWWSPRDCSGENYGFGLGALTQLMVGLFKFDDEISTDEIASLLAARGVEVSGLSFLDLVAAFLESVFNPPDRVDCNQFGLFPLGGSLITKLMEKGMIIDIDHMSNRSLDNTITMAQNFDIDGDGTADGYPLAASHVLFFDLNDQGIRHERLRTAAQLQSMRDLGGMIAVMLKDDVLDTGKRGERVTIDFAGSGVVDDCRHSSKTFIQSYMYGVDKMGGPVAMGSDFNGVAGHFGPRFGSDACGGHELDRSKQLLAKNRLPYPFTLDEFGSFDKQVSGQKTFDYNVHGLAHVGLLPDMIADMKNVGLSDDDLDPLFQSAEAYIKMWELARGEIVRDGCVCPGGDPTQDADGDGVPDDCDICPGGNDNFDADGDGVPNDCDTCDNSNDNCADAILVTEGQTAFCNEDATDDGPDDCVVPNMSRDVWFRFVAPAAGSLTVDLCAEQDYDTIMAVYTGACGALTLQGCDDDGCPLGLQSVISNIPVTAGQEVLIRIGAFAPDRGVGILTLDFCPDDDGDGVCNPEDICNGFDDNLDDDGDGVPDGCDVCPGADDTVDCNNNGVPDCVELSTEGLIGTYYPNIDFTGTPTVRVDPVIDFDWGTGEPFPGFGVDNFSIRWTGYVRSESAGTYTFTTLTDDGVRLWVDGQLLIDDWTTHAPTFRSGMIALAANTNFAITMEFFEGGGGAVAKLHWTPPGARGVGGPGPGVIIPATNLLPNNDCNNNGVPDDCDPDADGDGVPDDCDVCEGFDDNIDTDGDGVPDGCDDCDNSNDNCADALLVTEGQTTFCNEQATTDGPVDCLGNVFVQDVWFRYVAPAAGTVTVDTCTGITFDTVIEAYNGVCGALIPGPCDNDTVCPPGSSIDVPVSLGEEILIRVGGVSISDPHTGTGVLTLTFSCNGMDSDGDGDLDLDDYRNFEACLLGPGGGIGPGCDCFDSDGDGDVTIRDFADLQAGFGE